MLFVGLGNPGREYYNTRHNIGFEIIDTIHHRLSFSPWVEKFDGFLSRGKIDGVSVSLFKPMTFMNSSGEPLRKVSNYFKIDNKDILVFYDEMALDLGRIKITNKGSSAGHNGIKNIIQNIGDNFGRFRYGIGPCSDGMSIVDFVLGNFFEWEDTFNNIRVKDIVNDVELLAHQKYDVFMSKKTLKTR